MNSGGGRLRSWPVEPCDGSQAVPTTHLRRTVEVSSDGRAYWRDFTATRASGRCRTSSGTRRAARGRSWLAGELETMRDLVRRVLSTVQVPYESRGRTRTTVRLSHPRDAAVTALVYAPRPSAAPRYNPSGSPTRDARLRTARTRSSARYRAAPRRRRRRRAHAERIRCALAVGFREGRRVRDRIHCASSSLCDQTAGADGTLVAQRHRRWRRSWSR